MKIKSAIYILLLFLILQFITTKSYAWTWEEYLDFCHNIGNTTQTGTSVDLANRVYNNRTTIQNNVEALGINLDEYYNYIAVLDNNGSNKYLYILKKNITIEFSKLVSGYRYPIYISGLNPSIRVDLNNYSAQRDTGNLQYAKVGAVGLITNQTSFGTSDNYFWNKYINAELLRTDLRGLPEPYQFAKGTVGYSMYNSNYDWYIIQLINQNIRYTKLDATIDDQDDYIFYDLTLTNEKLENIDKEENCYLIYGTESTGRYQSKAFTLNFNLGPGTSGGMTNASGEIIFNIDLAGIENRLDNINGTIKSGDQEILNQLKQNESGDEKRFNVFKAMFDGLFTLSSGDIIQFKNKTQEIFEEHGLNGIEAEIDFFDRMNEIEPNDFIIKWDNYYYKNTLLIPSGDINFSAYARINPTFRQVHGWIRVLLTGALAIVCVRSVWKAICISFGIGMEMYDEAEEEKAVIETHHEIVDYNKGTTTYIDNARQGNTTKTIKRTQGKRRKKTI